jgi:hypothetical protein
MKSLRGGQDMKRDGKIIWWKVWFLIALLAGPVVIAHLFPARAGQAECTVTVSELPIIKNTTARRLVL